MLANALTPADWVAAVLRAGSGGRASVAEQIVAPASRSPSEPWPAGVSTLNEAFSWHVTTHPDVLTIRVLGPDGGVVKDEIDYGALDRDARLVAENLVEEKLTPGERVAIMLPTGRSYFAVFLGTLLAGGVPVPLYPPANLSQLEEHLRRQSRRVLENAEAAMLVTVPEARLAARLLRSQVPSLERIRTPEAPRRPCQVEPEPLPVPRAEDLALIQYTSGSTGDPKGVALTHTQLLANIVAMGDALEVNTADVFVSWLPLYHDLGLIGAWLATMFFGFPLVVMSPLTFLARPAAWLEAISRFSGTLSATPNFAYESCVERIADVDLDQLDLSSWHVAINGSEPVGAATLQRFAGRFGPAGFRQEAACPAYGLAEVGVGLTITPPGPRTTSGHDRSSDAAAFTARTAVIGEDARCIPRRQLWEAAPRL